MVEPASASPLTKTFQYIAGLRRIIGAKIAVGQILNRNDGRRHRIDGHHHGIGLRGPIVSVAESPVLVSAMPARQIDLQGRGVKDLRRLIVDGQNGCRATLIWRCQVQTEQAHDRPGKTRRSVTRSR